MAEYNDYTHLTEAEMRNINLLAEAIRHKVYGIDVRESIALAIELMLDIFSKENNDAVAEITKARNEFGSLDERLDNIVANLNNISVSQINKNSGKIDQTYLTDELIAQIAGTAAINAVPADDSLTTIKYINDSVTAEKVSFISTPHDYANSKNYTTLHSKDNYYNETGVLTPWAGTHSIVVPAKKNEVVRFYFNQGFDVYFTEWSATNTFLNGKRVRYTNELGVMPYIVSNLDTDYVLVNVAYAHINQITVTKNEKNTGFDIQNEIDINGQNIIDKSISAAKTEFIKFPSNIFDKTKATNIGYYLNDGTYKTDFAYVLFSTETIAAVKGDKIYFKPSIDGITRHVTEFDENGSYLTGGKYSAEFNPAGTVSSYTVQNQNAVGIKMNVHVEEVDDFIITKNQHPNSMSLDENININFINPFSDKTIGFLGDSITYGFDPEPNTGVPMANTWVDQVTNRLGFLQGINYGINSSVISTSLGRSRDLTALLKYEDMSNDIDLLMVQLGINDAFNNLPLGSMTDRTDATFYGSLHLLNQKLLAKYPPKNGKKIFWSNYFDYDVLGNWNSFSNAIEEVCQFYGIPFMDMKRQLGISPRADVNFEYWKQEGTTGKHNAHPTQLGANVIADFVANFINRNFSKL